MSIEQNKENCRRFLVDAGVGKHDFSLLADDFTSWTALGGEQPRSAMEAAPARMDKLFKGPIVMHVDGMIGEGNRVAMEAHSEGELVDGKLYRNTYHFLFEFDDEGKITRMREHCDSQHVLDTIIPLMSAGAK
jgi:ketosteroid isomerase-like protein